MKRYIRTAPVIFFAALALASCSKTEGVQGNPDSALQIESVSGISPFSLMQEPASKAVITGNTLTGSDAATGVGIFVTASNGGAYDGHANGYTNVKFSNSGSGWSTSTPVYLSDTEGKLHGYFPYNQNATDLRAIPVESSLNGTDYLYAEPQTVSHSNKSVSLTMNHALSRLHLTIKKGANFTASAPLSKITLKSTAIDATGTMDLATGAVTASKKSGETGTVELTTDGTITAEGIVKDILLVPANNREGKKGISISLMIAGKPAGITIPAENGLDIRSGIQNNVTLTVKDTGIDINEAGVGIWDEEGTQKVQVGACTITVKYDEGADGIQNDVWVKASKEGNGVSIKAFSESNKTITCLLDDDTRILPVSSGQISVFTIPNVTNDVIATIGVYGKGGRQEVNIGNYKVKFTRDDTEVKENDAWFFAYKDGSSVKMELSPYISQAINCKITGEAQCSRAKSGNIYTFTISDIQSDITALIRYSHITDIFLDRTTVNVAKDWIVNLKTSVEPTDAINKNIIWSSDNTSVATVDQNGNVTAISQGTANIIASTEDTKSGETVSCTINVGAPIDGTLIHEFTASDSKKVHFTKGNLWYGKTSDQATSATYNFENNQWEYYPFMLHYFAGDKWYGPKGQRDPSHISHFIWHKNEEIARSLYYDPSTDSERSGSDVLFTNNENFQVGNTPKGTFRTLSSSEWKEILFYRNASTIGNTQNARLVQASIQMEENTRVFGLILFPDVFVFPSEVTIPQGINPKEVNLYTTNVYTIDDWNKLQSAGCVFLPISGIVLDPKEDKIQGASGLYWSSDSYGANETVWLEFYNYLISATSGRKDRGLAIRLVADVK